MTYSWNTPFEGYPAGSHQGLTMGEALRRLKGAFYERMIIQHTIPETVGSEPGNITHSVGECGVVYIDTETPTSLYVEGGLQYYAPGFYYDTGSALTSFLHPLHANWTDLDVDADHPQYVPIAGGDFSADGLEWTVDNVTDLALAGEEFNPRSASVLTGAVNGKKAHVDDAADTYAKHKADCVTSSTSKTAGSFYIGYGKFKHTDKNEASDAGGSLHIPVYTGIVMTMPQPDFAGDFYFVESSYLPGRIRLRANSGNLFNATWMELD